MRILDLSQWSSQPTPHGNHWLSHVPLAGTDAASNRPSSPFSFLQDVRNEASKVTWPSRRETLITTGLVLLMVVVSSLFFLFTDTIIRWSLGFILGAR